MRKNISIYILLVLLIVVQVSCNTKQKPLPISADPEILAASEAVKLKITQDGIYRVNLSDLGWDANAIDSLSLTHQEQPTPYEIQTHGNDSELVFFGQASASRYTPDNYYVLEHDPTKKSLIETETASIPEGSSKNSFIQTIHVEENHLYVPKVEDGSTWHWVKIVAPQSQTIEVDLPRLASGSGQMRVALWGTTTAPTTPDHHVRISINGQEVGEAAWDDQSWEVIDVVIPDGVLVDGKNNVAIQATGEIEARIDIINLDWLEIDYPKHSDQIEGQEIFRTEAESVQLTGLEEPLTIFEISDPGKVVRLEFPSNTWDSVRFQGQPEKHYLAVTQEGYYSPDQIIPVIAEPDLRAEVGANYIAIGYPELLAPLKPLLQVRSNQGLSTLSIPIDAIYDQFNGGIPEPEAIQAFLAFAVENWETPPHYILLVGDTSYDFYGYQTPLEANLIPTFLVPTVFGGETGSDVRFVQLDKNLSPDLAIGRVPARSEKQVETFVTKILSYEKDSPNAVWNDAILAIADGQEPSFKRDADHFIEQFTEDFQTQIIAPAAGEQDTNQQISSQIEDGIFIAAYFGHGSVNMWGKDSLFSTQDSAILENGERLPIIWNFTCLTGLFTHPTEESLAESLLFNPDGGAVAVLAPTSPTLAGDQTFLSDALVEALSKEKRGRLGDITLYAWQQVPTEFPGTTDVMQTFLLFGDPALQLPSP